MKYLALLASAFLAGCAGPVFTDLGNGTAVPVESIEEYAEAHQVSRREARAELRAEAQKRRVKRHADTYGTSEEEARRQLAHSEAESSER